MSGKAEYYIYETYDNDIAKILCMLCDNIYQNNMRALLVFEKTEDVEAYNKMIWTFAQSKFIPHAKDSDQHLERQPILLTNNVKNCISPDGDCINQANIFLIYKEQYDDKIHQVIQDLSNTIKGITRFIYIYQSNISNNNTIPDNIKNIFNVKINTKIDGKWK
jgi:DNA polymerase IIIc chi subunit